MHRDKLTRELIFCQQRSNNYCNTKLNFVRWKIHKCFQNKYMFSKIVKHYTLTHDTQEFLTMDSQPVISTKFSNDTASRGPSLTAEPLVHSATPCLSVC